MRTACFSGCSGFRVRALLLKILIFNGLPALLTGFSLHAQVAPADSGLILEQASALFHQGREAESLELYLRLLEAEPDNFTAHWNAAIIAVREGRRTADRGKKEALYELGLRLANRAMCLRPGEGYAHYALAVALARSTDLMGARSRIETAHEIREHGYLAMEKLPDEAGPFFLMGVWHSEVANVSGAERFAARVISRGLPQADSELAESYIRRAMALDPDRAQFHLGLCEHFLRSGAHSRARSCLTEVTARSPRNPADAHEIETAHRLLNGL